MFLAVKQQDNSKIQLWYDKKLYIFAHVLLVITKVFFSTNKWKGVKYFVLASVSLMLPNFTIIYENIAWVFLCWKGSYDTSNTWYLPTVSTPYSDIDSSSETLKYDHSLWTLISFFPPTHGFPSTIYAACLHNAHFQLLRCSRAIKGTNLPSATHRYKIGWNPRSLVCRASV